MLMPLVRVFLKPLADNCGVLVKFPVYWEFDGSITFYPSCDVALVVGGLGQSKGVF
jgi:hypothetical protein